MGEQFPVTSGVDPSQLVGSVAPQQELEQVMADVVPLFGLPDQEFGEASSDYIERRVDQLSASTDAPTSIDLVSDSVGGFIPESTSMVPGMLMQKNYHLDDPTAYKGAMKYLRGSYHNYLNKNPDEPMRAYANAALQAAFYGQAEYFNGYFGGLEQRQGLLADIITDDDEPESPDELSIADFKGSAQCMERAAVAHNILRLAGVPSRLETGYLTVAKSDGSSSREAHAFLLVRNPSGREYIFDVMNPIATLEDGGTKLTARPSVYPIEAGSREPVTVTLAAFQSENGQRTETDARQLTFEFTDFSSIAQRPSV